MMGAMDGSELAYIGLGANVGAARVAMVQAVAALATLPECSLEVVSRLYRTRPVGPVEQGDFLNAAAVLRVPGRDEPAQGAMALLVALKQIEGTIGRQERERWGPREIDLDLLLFGGHQLRVERDAAARSEDPARSAPQWLEVPHPSAAQRLFVLAPLADLAPRLEPPGWGLSVAEARDRALETEGADAVRAIGAWDPAGGEWLDRAFYAPHV
jgi:2-amino-4-hydroxy-6-hydroxymethyldihydropteridine diphosphokinase